MAPTDIAASDIVDMVRDVVEVCSVPAGDHTVDEWMAIIEGAGAAMTVLAAATDAAIVRLAAIDEVVTEDGVVGEQVNGLGTRCRDAGAMVSTAAGVSARFGEEMVDQAITRVVLVPVLHEAMLDGSLDAYKARCVADELDGVPAELARTVVDALGEDLSTKTGPTLRRKTREILFALCPDLLKERIKKARSGVGLRRWVGQPGTDAWGGTFPSESSATAWAAINALARQYRLEGRYPTLEMARAHALLDLVNGNANVETVLHLTLSADALPEEAGGPPVDRDTPDTQDTPAALTDTGTVGAPETPAAAAPTDTGTVGTPDTPAASVTGTGSVSTPDTPAAAALTETDSVGTPETPAAAALTGTGTVASTAALTSTAATTATTSSTPISATTPAAAADTSLALTSSVIDRLAQRAVARLTDLDLDVDRSVLAALSSVTHPSPTVVQQDQVFIAVAGGNGTELCWMPLTPAFLDSLTRAGPRAAALSRARPRAHPPAPDQTLPPDQTQPPDQTLPAGQPLPPVTVSGTVQVAHPLTGALIDASGQLASETYRPGAALSALIRARDARCRFPGCSIAARQCDIDHVIAWPKGPTSDTNLICLCRRHHRVKQRHRWRVRLLPDRSVEWTDPSGRRLITLAVDHLGVAKVRHIDLGDPGMTSAAPGQQPRSSAGQSQYPHRSAEPTQHPSTQQLTTQQPTIQQPTTQRPTIQQPSTVEQDPWEQAAEARELSLSMCETRLGIIVEHLVAPPPRGARRRHRVRRCATAQVDMAHPRIRCTYDVPGADDAPAGEPDASPPAGAPASAHAPAPAVGRPSGVHPRGRRAGYGTAPADLTDPPPF